ncbi:MAG: DHH family phosphoesterase [Candidatus Buchananbacteria bacterium]|nr:DHH family phosphoesterase [Candidatus Buchananbacteria bacterium]
MSHNSILAQQINQAVDRARQILVVCHQRPDADAIGSLSAIAGWLDSINKPYTLFCRDAAPANLEWLTNFKELVTDPAQITSSQHDVVVVVDSSDLSYAGIQEVVQPTQKIINIDHHVTNSRFGAINLIDTKACSTSVIIYELFKTLHVEIKPWMASAMLAGIVGDTYNFTNPNTNDRALQVASDLLLVGASLSHVSDAILKNKELKTLQVWGTILSRMYYNYEYDVVIATVVEKDLQGRLATEVNEGIANFLNNLTGVKAALILQQQSDGIIKGSLRTNDELIDVSKLATILGGGGHIKAAGFKLYGRLRQLDETAWMIE